jgi:hypothetical protein
MSQPRPRLTRPEPSPLPHKVSGLRPRRLAPSQAVPPPPGYTIGYSSSPGRHLRLLACVEYPPTGTAPSSTSPNTVTLQLRGRKPVDARVYRADRWHRRGQWNSLTASADLQLSCAGSLQTSKHPTEDRKAGTVPCSGHHAGGDEPAIRTRCTPTPFQRRHHSMDFPFLYPFPSKATRATTIAARPGQRCSRSLTPEHVIHLRGARRAGPPPRPSTEPVTVHRRASATGVILVCRQRVNLGRIHAGQVVTVAASETTLAIDLGDGDTRVAPRTTDLAARNIKAFRPRTGTALPALRSVRSTADRPSFL